MKRSAKPSPALRALTRDELHHVAGGATSSNGAHFRVANDVSVNPLYVAADNHGDNPLFASV